MIGQCNSCYLKNRIDSNKNGQWKSTVRFSYSGSFPTLFLFRLVRFLGGSILPVPLVVEETLDLLGGGHFELLLLLDRKSVV